MSPPQASNIDAETGAIAVGDGPDQLATYIDFMCPVCGQFEELYGETIEGLVDDGSITLNIHPISILDRASQGTEFSTRSANAMYCVAVADAEASLPFLQAMYANQPEEGIDRPHRRADPRDRRREWASPGSTTASTTGATPST